MRALAIAAVGLLGCFTDFEDIEDQAWADSNGNPDGVASSDYGVAVAGVASERAGTTFVAVGANPLGIATVTYDAEGGLEQRGIDIAGNDERPVLLAADEPVGGVDGLVLVGLPEAGEVQLFEARTGAEGPRLLATIESELCGPGVDDFGEALAFGRTDVGDPQTPELLVLAGSDLLLFADFDPAATPTCSRCTITTGPPNQLIRSGTALTLADIDTRTPQLEVILTAEGNFVAAVASLYAGGDGGNCFEATPQIDFNFGNEPDFGAQIAVGDADDDGDPDFALSAPSSGLVYHQEISAGSPAGPVATIPERSDAVEPGAALVFADLDGDGADELIISDPGFGSADAPLSGRVLIHRFDDEDGYELAAAYGDSTPEPSQRFGRTLGVSEFNATDDTDLLLVGAAGEVFTYFRSLQAGVDPRR